MNGDDSFDWAKKPDVPDNRKRATIERLSSSKFCQKCALQGIPSPVRLFQINDEEALLMCKNVDCTFMPSTNWESLIVKRCISKLSLKKSKRSTSSSSISSDLSTKSDVNIQTNFRRTSQSGIQSRYSTTGLLSSSLLQTQLKQSAPSVSCSLPLQRNLTSPDPTQEFSLERKERKTLVPIAPFLSGHAHSFSSFETNKLEQKFNQRGVFVQQQRDSAARPNLKNNRITFLPNRKASSSSIVVNKRRACSLDSDSWSSGGSSHDSRPTTPVSQANSGGKKVKHVVVPRETFSKLLDGSMKLEISKSGRTGANIIFRSVKNTALANSYSNISEVESSAYSTAETSRSASVPSVRSESSSNSSFQGSGIVQLGSSSNSGLQERDIVPGGSSLQITEIGSLQEVLGSGNSAFNLPSLSLDSGSTKSHIEAINFQLQADAIKSHVEAINSHFQAIQKAVGCNDLRMPLDFSNLCQKFGVGISSEPTIPQVFETNQWISAADLRSESGNSGRNPLQSLCSSFTSVGAFETQVAVPAEVTLESNNCFPSVLDSEEFNKLQSYNFDTSHHLHNPFSGNFEDRH